MTTAHLPFRPSMRFTALAACLATALTTGAGAAPFASPGFPHNAARPYLRAEAGPVGLRPAWMQSSLLHAPAKAPSRPDHPALAPATSCEDDGSAGTLRAALVNAQDGDTVDLRQLTCSQITLQSGELASIANDLKILGPTTRTLVIDAAYAGRALGAQGSNLQIYDLTIAHGTGQARGGCIFVNGDVSLTRTTVLDCAATGMAGYGGALFAYGNLTMRSSTVQGSNATGLRAFGGGVATIGTTTLYDSTISGNTLDVQTVAFGGGIYAKAGVALHASIVSNNTAHSGNEVAYGGGIHSIQDISILDGSLVSGNVARADAKWSYGGGVNTGIYALGFNGPSIVTIEHSTISGNSVESGCNTCLISGGGINAVDSITASYSTIDDNQAKCATGSACVAEGGGLAIYGTQISSSIVLRNTTVSANSAVGGTQSGAHGRGGGLSIISLQRPFIARNSTIAFNHASTAGGGLAGQSNAFVSSELESTIVSNNDTDNGDNDIAAGWTGASLMITGAHNLVRFTSTDVTLTNPALTVDPGLLPLADNGGATATHALPAGSVALDAGSNIDLRGCDQRGFSYRRNVGSAPDIGAYEEQGEKHLFADSFDGENPCAPSP